ncbi:MauE/DoxX family redox-associated membrane protein [Albibacterium indicum]|uniref:MauE/DoxX family redox-associated membrane protein n=1 Tax=Albibacterium indicum TaxID=2292082 RepID=UPI000E54A30D
MERRSIIVHVCSTLLIILWVYTALSKVADVEVFASQLSRQPEPVSTLAPILVWVLPLVELVAATMLMFAQTRKSGLLLSSFLMLGFTVYVALAVIGYWEDIPCSCGGVLNRLGWKDHLWFNLFFLMTAALGLAAERHSKRSKHQGGNLKQAAPAGGPA